MVLRRGLAIAKRVVEIHGGVITAQSLPGTGTEFVVELPVQRPGNESARVY
jgi:signal transduction histidine kinase